MLKVISDGAKRGIAECQRQFSNRRWNCTTFNTTNVFGKVLQLSKLSRQITYNILHPKDQLLLKTIRHRQNQIRVLFGSIKQMNLTDIMRKTKHTNMIFQT